MYFALWKIFSCSWNYFLIAGRINLRFPNDAKIVFLFLTLDQYYWLCKDIIPFHSDWAIKYYGLRMYYSDNIVRILYKMDRISLDYLNTKFSILQLRALIKYTHASWITCNFVIWSVPKFSGCANGKPVKRESCRNMNTAVESSKHRCDSTSNRSLTYFRCAVNVLNGKSTS